MKSLILALLSFASFSASAADNSVEYSQKIFAQTEQIAREAGLVTSTQKLIPEEGEKRVDIVKNCQLSRTYSGKRGYSVVESMYNSAFREFPNANKKLCYKTDADGMDLVRCPVLLDAKDSWGDNADAVRVFFVYKQTFEQDLHIQICVEQWQPLM